MVVGRTLAATLERCNNDNIVSGQAGYLCLKEPLHVV